MALWAFAHLFKPDNTCISIVLIDLPMKCFRSLFEKRIQDVFWKKNEKQNRMKLWMFVWTCYKKHSVWKMQYFCLILPKYNIILIQ